MKKRPYLALLALAATLAPVASCKCSGEQQGTSAAQGSGTTAAAAPTLAEGSFQLQNGLAVDLVSGPCGDKVALVVLLGVGIDHDPPGRSGMARLAGRMLSTWTAAGRNPPAVETGSDYTLYSVVVASDRVADELGEVAKWMSQLAPTEADLARERPAMLEELAKLAGDDAAATAVSLAEEAVQPTRGNGKRRGVTSEVNAITVAELQAFWQAHFKPGNARITVAGPFDAAKVRERIEAALASLSPGTPPVTRPPGEATVRGTLVMGNAPAAVAVAVPAPATSDPLYGPFLVLAARLMEKTSPPLTWEVSYDPIRRPELLLITGPVAQGEQAEPAAGRIRAEAAAILARPPAAEDLSRARERFGLFLGPRVLDPAVCAKDARALAVARARHAQRGVDVAPLAQSLDTITKEQLEEAAKLFDTKRTAAVIAGGPIR